MPWRILPFLARPKCLSCISLTPCSASGCKPNRPHRRTVLSSKSSSLSAEITGIHKSPTKLSFGADAAAKLSHCGCLFPPAASKKPAVQRSNTSTTLTPAVVKRDVEEEEEINKESVSTAASGAASLERFEYESWSSSAILDGDDGVQSSFFDLPLELIRSTQRNGTDSPVKAAFVFESDQKGSMRKMMPSLESSTNHHVKFSTSSSSSCPPSPSSTCISPTMQKAREEFHAFLEARAA